MPHLEYRDGEGQLIRAEIREEAVIGRQLDCAVRLPEPSVSRRHARIVQQAGGWRLEDLGSSHGTLLNNARLSASASLYEGDQITVGPVIFVFRSAPPAVGMIGPAPLRRPSWSGRGVTETADLTIPQSVAPSRSKIEHRLRAAPDVESALVEAVGLAMSSTGATRGVLALREGSELKRKVQLVGRARASAPRDLHISEKFVELMLRGKKPRLSRDTDADRALASAESVVAVDIRSIVGAPLLHNGEAAGYLYLDTLGNRGELRGASFRESDMNAVREIAELLATEVDRRTG